MKLKDLAPKQGKFYLQHPVTYDNIKDDNGKEVFWYVVGRDSDEYLQAQEDFLRHVDGLSDDNQMTALDYKKQVAEQLIKVVKGWDAEFDDFMGGAYSEELLRSLLTSSEHKWIVGQLDTFVSSRKNFFLA